MISRQYKRLWTLVQTIYKYDLYSLIPKDKRPKGISFILRILTFWKRKAKQKDAAGIRLRFALQELGPVWIKFGQMLSTRKDILPVEIADQLSLLQDKVPPFDSNIAKKQIVESLNSPIEDIFSCFEDEPLACASIAQVHAATLRENDKEVVVKVIRPNIKDVILSDVALLFLFARLVEKLFLDGPRLRLKEIVKEYEKTIFNELNLKQEMANAIQLRRNSEKSSILHIPKVYPHLCSENVLVMNRIDGIPISDIEALKAQGTNMKLLAERGVEIFFTQVLRDSFFHADMHPGNIFVSRKNPKDPHYIGIDFGIVGTLSPKDKMYLAGNFLAFFNRDYRRVAELHVESGWVPENTNIEEFEGAIRTLCEPIFQKPLSEISFGKLLLDLFVISRRFNMPIQPQLFLLQKTLLHVEGLGRQLYPQLDLWQTAKPILESWLSEQIGWKGLLKAIVDKGPFWIDKIPEIPDLMYYNLRNQTTLTQHTQNIIKEIAAQKRQQRVMRVFIICLFALVIGLYIDR